MQLTLAWWNTALSPTRKRDRAEPAQLEVAAGVIRRLIEAGADLIVLCEVSERDVDRLVSSLGKALRDFLVLRTQDKAGASTFDTTVIHRPDLEIVAESPVVERHGRRTLRVAQKFSVANPENFHATLYIAHWPSRRSIEALSPYRALLGQALRSDIAAELACMPKIPLIVLSDFNDEPFDPSMNEGLLSTRDRALAELRPHLLYNPFWRHMTSYAPSLPSHVAGDKGTYFHAKGETTRWRTFDQMLFSTALLTGASGWVLSEADTRVFNDVDLESLVQDRSSIFDHLPIVGRVLRST